MARLHRDVFASQGPDEGCGDYAEFDDVDVEVTFDNAPEDDNAPTERFERRSSLPPPPVSEVGHALAEARRHDDDGLSESLPPSIAGSRLTPHMLPAIPVAIRPGPHGGVELVPIAEDDEPPDGAPTAVLVPDSSRDGAIIVRLLERELR